jgi:hypothetical protein
MMFYIFNSNNTCIGICDSEPDDSDLSSRGEFSIENKEKHDIGCTYDNDLFVKSQKSDAEKLSTFLKSVSTSINFINTIGLQCYMAGIDFPADWKAYRTELIALSKVSEYSDNLVLPTQPPLPSNI